MDTLWYLAKTIRPRQWVKNLAVFAPLVFSGFLYVPGALGTVTASAIVFIFLSSGVYIFNDLVDIEKDRIHPFKRNRPIAAGKLPMEVAVFAMISFFVAALWFSRILSFFFFWTALFYILLQMWYTIRLKQIPIIDVLVVASGYVMRVYAGAFVINVHMNVWFLLTVVSAALFLAIGKRRSEMTLLKGSGVTEKVRMTLKRYTEQLLDVYTSMFANATWLTYALFTFNHPPIVPDGRALKLYTLLPRTLTSEKLLMITTPLVVYGVMRYLQLIYERNEGESPERIFLSDKPLMATVVMWGITTVGVLYYL